MFAKLLVVLILLLTLLPSPVGVAAGVADRWSPVGVFRTQDGWYASPIHGTLLPDGRVFFIGIARDSNPPTAAAHARRVAWIFTPPPIGADPAPEVTINEITEPVEHTGTIYNDWFISDDMYCTGIVLDDTGRMVTAGGTRVVANPTNGTVLFTLGLAYQTVYDGQTWKRLPGEMVGTGPLGTSSRWYPTLTRLPDKRVLITGGLELITTTASGLGNRTVETLDPSTGARTLISDYARTPEATHARDYTHVFVLPYEGVTSDVLMIADAGIPLTTSANPAGTWNALPARPGPGGTTQPNWGASSVMLPIRLDGGPYRNGSVFIEGGDMMTPYEHTGDVLDPVTGTWSPSIDMSINRHHPSAVVLADSRVLIVNGHDMMGGTDVMKAQYVDPLHGWTVATSDASSGVIRGYHSIALLLPDGRVLVGGGRDVDTATSLEKPSYQIYSPDYLTRLRPEISDAPTQIGYGGLFTVPTVGKPSEVVLLGLGSMTHSFDTGQRSVQLPIGVTYSNDQGASLSVVGGPANAHVAPPGYYQLVVLDQARTPSLGRIVHIG
jgi:hypothetical protein